MKLAAHQPNLIPWSGYFKKMMLADTFVLLDSLQFSKGSYTNRTSINSNGSSKWLTIPVEKKFQQKISDVTISSHFSKQSFLDKIKSGYNHTPYFSDYFIELQSIITGEHSNKLIDWNIKFILWTRKVLDIQTPLIFLSDLNLSSTRNQLLIDLCKRENADIYLAGEGGDNYHDPELFRQNNIHIETSKKPNFEFDHSSGHFVYGTSIIDLLFHKGPESIQILKNES